MDCPKRNALDGLPDDAMLEILARTPFRSVCRSKCVAKAWRDLIDDPLNRTRLPQTLQGFFHMFLPMWNRDDGSSDLDHSFVKYLASPMPLDIHPCLSFLMKLPETESVDFLDSCNGLLLFEHYPKSNPSEVLSYIVCNPATKHWGTVPVCARCLPPKAIISYTYLAFNPAVSSHFHLIQFWKGFDGKASMLDLSVHTYSSETGVWSHSQSDDGNEHDQLEAWRHPTVYVCSYRRAFLNGNLHCVVFHSLQERIVAVDVQGKTKSIITMPPVAKGRRWRSIPYIGQSQGHLHYINGDYDPREFYSYGLSIWALQDYDTQKWVLKDTVSFLELFGSRTVHWRAFRIIAIHPDCNVVFFLYFLERLIAYDMDLKQVSIVSMLSGSLNRETVPYIPCFSESPALTKKN